MELQVVAMTAAQDLSGTAGTPPTLPSTVGTTGTPTTDVLPALHNTGIAASAGEDINGTLTAYVPVALDMTGTAATIVSAGAATDKLLNATALASLPPAPIQIAADIKNAADELPDSRVVPA
ncbi:hypothetical protein C0991_002155, partial [Blastosporella zonata]